MPFKFLMLAMAFLYSGLPAAAEKLDIERVFSDPDLSGTAPRSLKFSPDGTQVSYLQGKDENYRQLDLWVYDIQSGERRLLVDSARFSGNARELDDVEKARRERQRISGQGIVEYFWSADASALLFPIHGDLFHYAVHTNKLRQITNTPEGESDPKFSPDGRYVSFIRDQNIYVVDLKTGKELALTEDGAGLIRNGMAEYVAEEEMQRFTGYWWSPDSSRIAFTQTDETPVEEAQRYEIYAATFKLNKQRFPRAGTPNVLIKLGVVKIKNRKTVWMDLGDNPDIYLARVNWLPDSKHLGFQRLARDQKSLDLLVADIKSGESRLVLHETADSWINLNDDLTFLADGKRFIWSSEQSGYRHLYLYNMDGKLLHALTGGDWAVNRLLKVDEEQGLLYFDGYYKTPLEQHFYHAQLDGSNAAMPEQITRRSGWHNVTISPVNAGYIDSYADPDTPPQVCLHIEGAQQHVWMDENRLGEDHPYYPYLDNHAPVEFGKIKAEDGKDLYYRLTKPADFNPDQKYPALVHVYGGPHAQLVRRTWGPLWYQALAAKGYIIFTVDNRGSAHRGRIFEEPLYRRLAHAEVRDQLQGVSYLKTLDYIDPARLGLFGWSYGGYMTLMTLMQSPGTFSAGVSGAPVTDWRLYDTHYTERYLGDPVANEKGYDQSSVLSYTDALADPLMIIHGMADDNVTFQNSTSLISDLQRKNKPFEVMVYPGETHSIRDKALSKHLYNTIFNFLDRHLKPED